MGEAGRKLTIRMPDSSRLTSAEVTSLHVEPGGRASVGAPVMTLRAHRREHIVRSPRPGRIVPLVGPGDRVRGGDPLYVLNLDEAALAKRNSEARALVATERARWAGAAESERIQVMQRSKPSSPGALQRLLAAWGGPMLAIAFYVAACFAFLPVLGAVSDASPAWGRALLLAAVGLLGLLIFRLYAPRFPGWPRNLVRLVAIAWVGIAAFAVLHRPTGPDDLTLGRAGERVAGMLWPGEKPAVAPKPSPSPEAVDDSGVYAGPPDRAAPAPAEPRTGLAGTGGPVPDEHGVTVRPLGRQNPTMASGEPPRHAPADAAPPVQAAPSEIAAAWPVPLAVAGPAGSPPPGAPERTATATVPMQVTGAMPPPVQTGEDPVLSAGRVAGDGADPAPPERTAPVSHAGAAPAPLALTEALAEAPGAGWLSAGLPVVIDEGAAAPALPDRAPAGAPDDTAGPAAVAQSSAAALPGVTRSPEPVLATALRAGQSDLMERAGDPAEGAPALRASGEANPATAAALSGPQASGAALVQAEAPVPPAAGGPVGEVAAVSPDGAAPVGPRETGTPVGDDPSPAVPDAPETAADPEPVLASALRAGSSDWMDFAGVPAEDAPVAAAALRSAGAAPEGAPSLAAKPDVAPDAVWPAAAVDAPPLPAPRSSAPDGPAPGQAASTAVPSVRAAGEAPAPAAAPGGLAVAMAPAPAPAAPATPEEPAERRLLFLYYDDPRLETHPREGDQWLPAVAPEAAEAIRSARVEEVREVVEVTDWCTAEDPTAALSDRIRLLEVRLDVDPAGIERVESELPVLAGAPPGFFHNQAPLLGGAADAPLMQLGRAFLDVGEQGAPEGRYFDSEPALARALDQAGCRRIEWNGGDGPANEIGRALSQRIAG